MSERDEHQWVQKRVRNLPPAPAPEDSGWKCCSRVRGERTLQFYALRHRWDWRLSDKTRDIVEQMRIRFGRDLDVITLMGHVDPQPLMRDWRRFDSELEVVDLGRSKKRAEALLTLLIEQVKIERSLRELAEGISDRRVHWELVSLTLTRKDMRTSIAEKIVRGGLSSVAARFGDERLSKLAVHERNGSVASAILKDVRERLPEDQWPVIKEDAKPADKDIATHRLNTEKLLPRVREALANLTNRAMEYDGKGSTNVDDEFQRAYELSEPKARASMLTELTKWENNLVRGQRAREIMRRRAATVASVAHKLGGV